MEVEKGNTISFQGKENNIEKQHKGSIEMSLQSLRCKWSEAHHPQ